MTQISKADTIKLHNKELDNLTTKNQLELEKIKLNHEKQKEQIKNNNQSELITMRSRNEQEKLEKINKQQRTLDSLNNSLQDVKKRTEAEKKQINEQLNTKKENLTLKFKNDYEQTKNKNQFLIKEVNDKYRDELKDLHQNYQTKKRDLNYQGNSDLKNKRFANSEKLKAEKSLYKSEKEFLDDIHHQRLNNQEKEHRNYLLVQERKFQDQSQQRKSQFDEIIKSTENDGKGREQNKKDIFEKRYQSMLANQEKLIQGVHRRKEDVLNKLENEIISTHKLNQYKKNDPFYTKTKLDYDIQENDKSYTFKVKIPKEEIDNLNINVQKRDVKLVYDRRYENIEQGEDGQSHKVNKVETIVNKFNVKDILDEKAVTKNYKDNFVEINVKKA